LFQVTGRSAAVQGSRPSSGRQAWLVAAIAALNVLGSGAGAVGMATGWLALSETAHARLPWGSTVLAGVALALAVAFPNAVLFLLAVGRDSRWGAASIGVGIVLVCWIVVELAFIRELSFLHPLYAGVGLLLVWLGARQSTQCIHEAGSVARVLAATDRRPVERRLARKSPTHSQ
jgi:hypothetical protein